MIASGPAGTNLLQNYFTVADGVKNARFWCLTCDATNFDLKGLNVHSYCRCKLIWEVVVALLPEQLHTTTDGPRFESHRRQIMLSIYLPTEMSCLNIVKTKLKK